MGTQPAVVYVLDDLAPAPNTWRPAYILGVLPQVGTRFPEDAGKVHVRFLDNGDSVEALVSKSYIREVHQYD
jgi:hypothetical protein